MLQKVIQRAKDFKTTVSIGATIVCKQDTSIDNLISRADRALYKVKNGSKGTWLYSE